ncbi:hypothetical protein SLE2022_234060 [Rubroshorea leprosula]
MYICCRIGQFLGYVVSKKGIEVNPDKVEAVQQMEPLKTIKDVQRLIGRLAALHRFIAKLAENAFRSSELCESPRTSNGLMNANRFSMNSNNTWHHHPCSPSLSKERSCTCILGLQMRQLAQFC